MTYAGHYALATDGHAMRAQQSTGRRRQSQAGRHGGRQRHQPDGG